MSSDTSHPTSAIEDRDSNTWSACCSKTDVGFIKYVTQVGVAVMLIIFSMIQISIEADNREITVRSILV
jgi:hypothetical protein